MHGRLRLAAICAAVIVGAIVIASEKPSPEYQTAMKNLGTANAGLRGAITNKDYAAIEMHAATFKASFTAANQFWTAKKQDDAIKFTQDGLKGAADLDAAAKAKNDDGINAARGTIGATCRGCHMVHRDQISENPAAYEINVEGKK
jgi:cytochrome c556